MNNKAVKKALKSAVGRQRKMFDYANEVVSEMGFPSFEVSDFPPLKAAIKAKIMGGMRTLTWKDLKNARPR